MTTAIKGDELRRLIARLDAASIQQFQGATNLCVSRSHFEVAPDHLLLRMLDEATGDVTQILNAFNVNRVPIRRAVLRALDGLATGHTGKPVLSTKLVELFQAAALYADEFGSESIRPGLLLLAMALNPGHLTANEFTQDLQRIDVDQLRDHFMDIVQGPTGEPAAADAARPASGEPGSALTQFTTDLTAKAAAGGIDPVIGRDHEIRQMIDVFARRRKNNPILVGEPGTGKTAIVEGLALRIVQGDVPPILRGVKLISLDLGVLQAGASVKGEFENRLKNVIKEIKASETPIITFIDEAHTLIGAGGQAGGSDAANLLKPALARGELRTVAATTWSEYKKYFEKDAALERRFQLIRCEEPSAEDTVVMLRGLKDKYEKHHKVLVSDDAIVAAAELSKRYISGRFLPDKAVDLLDTASARVAVALSTRPADLEDIDRRLTHLDTAIQAIRRDYSAGSRADDSTLVEMNASREALLVDRKKIEERWKAEQADVQRILELRSQLRGESGGPEGMGHPAEDGDGRAEGGTGSLPARGESRGAQTRADKLPVPPCDQDKLREQIREAIATLKKTQGAQPLLHPHVDESAVAAVVSDWTGIPVGKMVKDEIAATLKMEDRLRARVVGQDQAISIIAQKLRTCRKPA